MAFYDFTRSFTALTLYATPRSPGAARLADVSDTHCWSLTIQHPELAANRSPAAHTAARFDHPLGSRDIGFAIAVATLALVGSALAALLAGGPPAPESPAPIAPEVARAIAERCASAPAACVPRAA